MISRGCIALLLLAFVAAMAGCGGGGGSSVTPPVETSGVTMTVGADLVATAVGDSDSNLDITSPLANAVVKIYDFATGEIIDSGTPVVTAADGTASIQVPTGKSVLIEITGSHVVGGQTKQYRLTRVISRTPNVDFEVEVDFITSVAAEAIGTKLFKHNEQISEEIWDAVYDAANDFFGTHNEIDYSLGGGLFVADKKFGEDGSLVDEVIEDVLDDVPDEGDVNSPLIQAKNAIAQIKEFGIPWENLMEDELPNIENTAEAFLDSMEEVELGEVEDTYTGVITRLDDLMIPAIGGDWEDFNGDEVGLIMDLDFGVGYEAEWVDVFGDEYLVLTPNQDIAEDDEVRIVLETEEDTQTLIMKDTVGKPGYVTLTQTSSADAEQEYTVTMPQQNPFTSNPTITGEISLMDGDLEEAIEFEGTITAVGAELELYTSATFAGTLTSANLEMQGNAAITFLDSVPQDANEEQEIHDFATRMTLSNASMTLNGDGATVSLSADTVDVVTTRFLTDGWLRTEPEKVTLDGASLSVARGSNTFELSGSVYVELMWVEDDWDSYPVPKIIELEDGVIELTANSNTLRITGDMEVTGTTMDNEDHDWYPTDVSLSGGYTNAGTDLEFTGSISGKLDDLLTENMQPGDLDGNLAIEGTIQREGFKAYQIDISFAASGSNQWQMNINKLGFGGSDLTGSGTVAFAANGEDISAINVTLTNQNGVVFEMTTEDEGIIKVDDVDQATITSHDGRIRVDYTDSTFDEF